MAVDINGCDILPLYVSPAHQKTLIEDVHKVVAQAPFVRLRTRHGYMSVQVTAAGQYFWYADEQGYRYQTQHPSGVVLPSIPESILSIWHDLVSKSVDPECCLINFYDARAKMGLHQDKDEADFSWPVVSISLGDTAVFRVGGLARRDPSKTVPLRSGDVVVIGGRARLVYHGIDRVSLGSSSLIPGGGRVNITLRVVRSVCA